METLVLKCAICKGEIILQTETDSEEIVAKATHVDCALLGGND